MRADHYGPNIMGNMYYNINYNGSAISEEWISDCRLQVNRKADLVVMVKESVTVK